MKSHAKKAIDTLGKIQKSGPEDEACIGDKKKITVGVGEAAAIRRSALVGSTNRIDLHLLCDPPEPRQRVRL